MTRQDHVIATLLGLRPRHLWRFFGSQNAAFWACCVYLFVEYVRPQQFLGPLVGMPLGQLTLAWAVIAFFVSGGLPRIRGAAGWLFLAFSIIIVLSSITAYDRDTSFDALWLWLSWVVVYFLITNVVNTRPRVLFFVMLWMLFHLYMAQGGARQFIFRGFTFAKHGLVGAPGWFENSGEFGLAMAMLLVISVHFFLAAKPFLSRWKQVAFVGVVPVSAVLVVIGSSSRGDQLALAALGIWAILRTRYRARMLFGVAVLGAAAWAVLPQEAKQRFSESGQDSTSTRRLTYWRNGLEMAAQHPILGVGFSNWIPYYEDHYPERVGAYEAYAGRPGFEGRVEVAHNSFIECISELGYAGFLVLMLLIMTTFVTNYRTRRAARAGPAPPDQVAVQLAFAFDGALIAWLVGGFFMSVLYYPFFWVNLAMTVALNHATVRSRPSARAARRAAAIRPASRGRQNLSAG